MNDQSEKSQLTIFEDLRNAISSQASADGVSLLGWLAGLTPDTSGLEAVPVNPGARRGAALVPMIPAIFGQRGSSSSSSASLQASLENRLRAQTDSHGLIACMRTWSEQTTPSGRRICRLTRSGPITNGNGFGLLPTPRCSRGWTNPTVKKTRNDCVTTKLLGAPALGMRPHPRFIAFLMGFPIAWVSITGLEMPSSRKSRKSSLRRI